MASLLEQFRQGYAPSLPQVLQGSLTDLALTFGETPKAVADADRISAHFPRLYGRPVLRFQPTTNGIKAGPKRVGVMFSGGPAPGGHNVILGLFDGLKRLHKDSVLIGFLQGPDGLLKANYNELTKEIVYAYRNTGGFDMIASGRTKVETPEQFEAAKKTCRELELDALVVIGGDDSNTNAAVLAETFERDGMEVQVIGVPKTIDGDLKGTYVDVSFGFDTATKVYSELVGNICRDARSAAKYWHFIKLMGRSASHVTLEVALQTHANITILGEEVAAKESTLAELADEIADVVEMRAEAGKSYGVVVVSEGLLEFVPEMGRLIAALNALFGEHATAMAEMPVGDRPAFAAEKLEGKNRKLFESLPEWLTRQLLDDPDPHGNLKVSQIETDRLLIEMVKRDIAARTARETFKGKFQAQGHFFGYEGRCVQPSNLDADYTYGLGTVSALLVSGGVSGYMAVLQDLHLPREDWRPGGAPLTAMMNMETRKGKEVPVIKKALLDLNGAAFKYFDEHRSRWATQDSYNFPGPIQYFGPDEVCNRIPVSLRIERGTSRSRH